MTVRNDAPVVLLCPFCGKHSKITRGDIADISASSDQNWMRLCPYCNQGFHCRERTDYSSTYTEVRYAPQYPMKSEHINNANKDSFTFACIICKQQLRVTLPINDGYYSCPGCKIRYQPVKSSAMPYVFVLVPENLKSQGEQTPPPNRTRVIPKEVRAALAVFDLDETATAEDAKRAYRHAVHQYHPDKVAHLGPELRKVAEQKTKEYVAAFEVLEKYFSENQ